MSVEITLPIPAFQEEYKAKPGTAPDEVRDRVPTDSFVWVLDKLRRAEPEDLAKLEKQVQIRYLQIDLTDKEESPYYYCCALYFAAGALYELAVRSDDSSRWSEANALFSQALELASANPSWDLVGRLEFYWGCLLRHGSDGERRRVEAESRFRSALKNHLRSRAKVFPQIEVSLAQCYLAEAMYARATTDEGFVACAMWMRQATESLPPYAGCEVLAEWLCRAQMDVAERLQDENTLRGAIYIAEHASGSHTFNGSGVFDQLLAEVKGINVGRSRIERALVHKVVLKDALLRLAGVEERVAWWFWHDDASDEEVDSSPEPSGFDNTSENVVPVESGAEAAHGNANEGRGTEEITDGTIPATDIDAGADFAKAVAHARKAVEVVVARLQERLDEARRFVPTEAADREALVCEVDEALALGIQIDVDGQRVSRLLIQRGTTLTWQLGNGSRGFRKNPATVLRPEPPTPQVVFTQPDTKSM